MITDVDYINERVLRSSGEFIAECYAKYEEDIRQAAEKIRENLKKSPIVLLSGPSGSGKTTTSKKLELALEALGINTHSISMDDYYKNLDPLTAKRMPDGDIDLETPDILDFELLNEHFRMLARGEEIRVPHFLFDRQARSEDIFTPVVLKENEIVIIEGIHAFNSKLTDSNPDAFKLYISPLNDISANGKIILTATETRLIRRTVRDNNFRGTDARTTIEQWNTVIYGEETYILPNAYKADHTINSSVPYELSVLKPYAIPLFLSHGECDNIVSALCKFVNMSPEGIDERGLLREFIGGSAFTY